ncbi:hypothetical protein NHX12_019030 [Muraenolepis orangiensis]|uniref:KASH domain-containing protein n=1 Tax=Muraenolepis orangiensis TaxID=630683 RepID=A0A9Q0ESD5_9TELE|nr:hypothetical protein NHX12_019030 [Muraenolepis orangiensis]
MTQQEQQEFRGRLEGALSWMRAAQDPSEKDGENIQDHTKWLLLHYYCPQHGTAKIHSCQHEGLVLVDVALVAAEALLQASDKDLRGDTNAKLKDLKAQWEETSTYILHCHSRIEWVWLHWSEYLKAHEEFEVWLARLRARLAADVELQLGAREKLWQADHQRVVLSDVCGQAPLLQRLLDEAEALHERTQDPSVEPAARKALQQAYVQVRDGAEERLSLLQKMAEEHQVYLGSVHKFHTWLLSKTQELTELLDSDASPENRFQALQALDSSVAGEEMTLQHLETVAEAVQVHTSPGGAQQVAREAQELRQGWLRLRQELREAGEGLRAGLDAHSQYLVGQQRLGQDIGRLRLLLQELGRELDQGREGDRGEGADLSEEQLVDRWRKFTGMRNTLTSEEPQVEHLKAQLKDLFRFSVDSRHLSDDVLAVVKEHQSMKCRAARLCSESESSLRQVLRDPLHFFSQWSEGVSQVLEASAEVTDFSHLNVLAQNIERLLKHSVQLQERLSLLQARADLLAPVFGPQSAEGLVAELSAAIHSRDLLHTRLLQRKKQLQGMLATSKQFGHTHEGIFCTLSDLQDRLSAVDVLQPDILAKKSKADQLGVILKDLEDCEAHITALETLVSSSDTNRTQYDRLFAQWKLLYKTVRVKVGESEDAIVEHEDFHESLLSVEKWLMVVRQKLESFRGPSGDWSRTLGEFPEKELQLHQTEARGLVVLDHTSQEGRVHIVRDVKRLRDSWMALHDLSLNLYRLLNSSTEELNSDLWRVDRLAGEQKSGLSKSPLPAGGVFTRAMSGPSRREGSDEDSPGPSHSTWACQSQSSAGERNLQGADVGLRAGYELLGSGAQSVEAEASDAERELQEGSYRRGLPVFGTDDEVNTQAPGSPHLLGWTEARAARQAAGGGRSPGEAQVSVASASSATVGSTVTADRTGGRSPGVKAVSGRGQGGGAGSLRDVAWAETPERTRWSGGTAAEGLGQGGGAFTLFRRDAASLPSSPPPQRSSSPRGSASYVWESDPSVTEGAAQYESRRREFEAWLLGQNELLSGLLAATGSALGPKELKIRTDKLQALRASVDHGKGLFQLVIQDSQRAGLGAGAGCLDGPELTEDAGLEELRYRWMLYKSKLKEVGDLRIRTSGKGVRATKGTPVKAKRILKPGPGLLQRVCRVALPLWLLFMALLLLAFLLPWMEGSSSCSLTNNFARSFNLMLRYDGPPPT